MVEKIKTNVDRLLLVSKLKRSSFSEKSIGNFFFFMKTKNISMSLFIYSTISQILETIFYLFWAQTCRNWTKLLTFLKYYMLLIRINPRLDWFRLMLHIESDFTRGIKKNRNFNNCTLGGRCTQNFTRKQLEYLQYERKLSSSTRIRLYGIIKKKREYSGDI